MKSASFCIIVLGALSSAAPLPSAGARNIESATDSNIKRNLANDWKTGTQTAGKFVGVGELDFNNAFAAGQKDVNNQVNTVDAAGASEAKDGDAATGVKVKRVFLDDVWRFGNQATHKQVNTVDAAGDSEVKDIDAATGGAAKRGYLFDDVYLDGEKASKDLAANVNVFANSFKKSGEQFANSQVSNVDSTGAAVAKEGDAATGGAVKRNLANDWKTGTQAGHKFVGVGETDLNAALAAYEKDANNQVNTVDAAGASEASNVDGATNGAV